MPFAQGKRLPDFISVGPPRTATTWLHRALRPHVCLPDKIKETYFFDRYYHRGIEWYLENFPAASSTIRVGEFAPTYFYSAEAIARIAKVVPAGKIICTFRDPVERLYSHYKLRRHIAATRLPFLEAISSDPELRESKRYAWYLRMWQRRFGAGNVAALIHNDLETDPQEFLNNLCRFIGAPAVILKQEDLKPVHSSKDFHVPQRPWLVKLALAIRDRLFVRHRHGLVDMTKRLGLKRMLLNGDHIETLHPDTESRLRENLRPEVEALEDLLGRNLSAWKYTSANPAADSPVTWPEKSSQL